ncbi:HAD hydrolase-like protein [Secundilactobacillus silagei]|uniref:HAD hydrolase-like protein n=1 Tax=Secundilactobacillus silagei TaxID=1293415 RepID=UPI000A5AC104|nr:HAD hydrolase-like protein [Secundilactobacillus silagei]
MIKFSLILTAPLLILNVGSLRQLKKMVTVMQLPRLTDAQYRLFIGPTLTVSLKRFFPTLSQEQVTAAVKQYQKEYDTKGLYQLDVYPGIEAALTTLKSAGYQLNVASAKPEWVLRRIIDKFQLNTYFNGIYGATSDERVRSSKTAILAYGIEKKRCFTKSQCDGWRPLYRYGWR